MMTVDDDLSAFNVRDFDRLGCIKSVGFHISGKARDLIASHLSRTLT